MFSFDSKAQNPCDSTMVISGWIFQGKNQVVPASMAVNRNSGGGAFVERDGSFLVRACEGDTLVFGAIGYYTVERVVIKSMRNESLNITLRKLEVELATAEIFAPRTLNQIIKEIEALGYNEKDYRISDIDAFQSPITFLYEQFSREERSKREVAELENTDKRRELLQELFSKYVDYEIIQLDPNEFKSFAEFCDPGDELLKEWSQYDFIIYVKRQFAIYRMMPRKLDDSDYQYNTD
ncbi:MAG: hypothetical protein CL847_04305 [Crocinitomicaceae bacterium]|nr:hypothetical protein [Crocinitomicaceae bacterium]|tara:strand:+ start:1233 stop:1943 length:711 start_codon:yes stop_codon:yes gene_type:complete